MSKRCWSTDHILRTDILCIRVMLNEFAGGGVAPSPIDLEKALYAIKQEAADISFRCRIFEYVNLAGFPGVYNPATGTIFKSKTWHILDTMNASEFNNLLISLYANDNNCIVPFLYWTFQIVLQEK